MGAPDPRLTSQKELDIRLRFQYRCYNKQDPLPNRVKPTPLQVLCHISSIAMASCDPPLVGECNMIIITYLFLLRPGEYTGFKSDITPLHLKDITFSCGYIVFATTATEGDLHAAHFVMLTFTTQKNGVRGKKVGHKASGDPLLCPKEALPRQVIHLRSQGAPPSTPLVRIMTPVGWWENISPTMISKNLKTAVGFYGQTWDLKPRTSLPALSELLVTWPSSVQVLTVISSS